MYGAPVTGDGVDFQWIMATLERRRQERGRVLEQMRLVRDCYNGDLIIPLPELDTTERSSVANLVVTGIDQTAQRIASVMPLVDFPSVRPGFDVHDARARTRTQACQSWWKANRMPAKMRRRARWLVGYGFAPALIRPDYNARIPRWEIRDPLSAYPSPTQDPDDICPTDAIFTYFKSYGWLRQMYPEQIAKLRAMTGTLGGVGPTGPQQYELVEYVDAEVTVLGVMGPKQFGTQYGESQGIPISSPYMELERCPTPGGICPAVIPGRIVLDSPKGQFDDAIGPYQLQARLMALEVLAVERGVFPDTYLISRQNEVADFVAGPFDGRTGQVNIVKGGDIREQNLNPGFATTGVMDRLERAQRVSSSIPAEYGGECVPLNTDILTVTGWRAYDQVKVGDQVLTLNHETGLSEWQPVLAMHVYPGGVPHKMIEMEGPRFSAETTLGHRWPVVRRNGDRVFRTSAELAQNDRIPTAAYCADLPAEAKWSDAVVELVAWYWGEGTSGGLSSTSLSQSYRANPHKCERIRSVLLDLFGPRCGAFPRLGRMDDPVPRWREERIQDRGMLIFRLNATAAQHVLLHVSPGRSPVPTYEFIRDLTAAQLALFIDTMMAADNCGPTRLGQKSKASADAFSFAVLLSGRAVSFQVREKVDPRPGWPDSVAHIVRIKDRRYVKPAENAAHGRSTFREVERTEGVWCPTTSNGTWLARRGHGTAYFTGNSQSNVRTGRRGESIISAATSFPIQEAQEVFADALAEENRRAVAVMKACFGRERQSFLVTWDGRRAQAVDYVVDETFDTDVNSVTYPAAGSDANALIVGLGQRVGLGILSKRTASELDPMVSDPEFEEDRVTAEALTAALLASLQAQAQQGAIPPHDLAAIAAYVRQNKGDVFAAVEYVQKQAQERQASAGPPGTPAGPVAPGAPEAQPGLAAPGAGAEQPTVGPTPGGLDNFAGLLSALGQGA